MSRLTYKIKQLEHELMQHQQTIQLEWQNTKSIVINKITSPPLLLIAFIAGGLLGKKAIRNLQNIKKSKAHTTKAKVSILQKLIAISSEISVAINIFNRFKPLLVNLMQKTDRQASGNNAVPVVSHKRPN